MCVVSAVVFAQTQELMFFEDFENPEMTSFVEYTTVDESAKLSTINAISGNASLEVNTLGKKGIPLTVRLDCDKLRLSDKESTLVTVSFKYKVLGGNNDKAPRNYFLCDVNNKRTFTEVFGEKVGKSGKVKITTRFLPSKKYNLEIASLDGSHIAIDDFKVERSLAPKESDWLYQDNVFVGMRFLPTHPYFLTLTAPENKISKDKFFPFIDKFGQYKHRDWDFKIKTESDFSARIKEEEAYNASLPKIKNLDKYLGFINPKYKFKATGHFYTKKVDGKWWFITPEGNLFWSHGIDTVGMASDTPTTNREHYFEDISDQRFVRKFKANKHSFKQGELKLFDFGNRNLTLKYGENFHEKYSKVIGKRLSAWGINTCGAWSIKEVMRNSKIPYTLIVNSYGAKPLRGNSKLVEYWQPMADYFEPDFERNTHISLAESFDFLRSPYCIGTFVDNELPWQNKDYMVAIRVLSCPKIQRAKQVFMLMLKDKYIDIEKLNVAWEAKYETWNDFLNTVNFVPKTEQGKADMLAFEIKYYERYFSVCRSAVKSISPETMYLGCRFASANPTVVKVASKYCDVISYNMYRDNVADVRLPNGSNDKPILIGEFHFSNQDRGIFGGALSRKTMKGRVDAYEKYVVSALENSAIVGAHWFRWLDQPTTGRCGDGENYSVGMVDICDTPVYPMIKKAHELSTRLYDVRIKSPAKNK